MLEYFKSVTVFILSLFYFIIGIKHFTDVNFFISIMPSYIPYHKFFIYLSGFFEILFGLLLLFRKTRKFAGIGLMLITILALGAVIMDSGIKTITTDSDPVDFREIGGDFLTYYWPALILMALILAGSVMGALVLARREDTIENEQ